MISKNPFSLILLFFLLLFFFFSGSCPALAKDSVPAPDRFPYLTKTYHSTSYYEEDGLASNTVFGMTQAKDGLMWFITQKGLTSFDGLRWKSTDENLVPVDSERSKLLPTQGAGLVYLGVGFHHIYFRKYDGKNWEELPLPSQMPKVDNRNFTQISFTEYQSEQFYASISHRESLYLYNSATKAWQQFFLPKELDYKKLLNMHFFQNKLFLFFQNQLVSFDLDTHLFDLLPFPELKDKTVLDASISPEVDKLFLLGHNFVGKIEAGHYSSLLPEIYKTTPPHLVIYNILADSHGRLFFNHNAAHFIYHIESGHLEEIKIDDPESEAMASDIFEDTEGNIWFSTLRSVHKVSSFRFHTFKGPSGILADEVSTIFPIDQKTILLGGNNGLNILTQDESIRVNFQKNRYNSSLTRILDATRTSEGEIFLAANGLGIGKLLPDFSVNWYKPPKEELIASITLHHDSLFAGSYSGTLYYFDGQKLIPVWEKEGLYMRQIISVDNTLYLLTNRGVYVKQGKGDFKHIPMESLKTRNVYSYLSWNGRIFFGTLEGLAELKNGRLEPVKAPELQLKRPVYALLEDLQGHLWLGTDKGVYLYKNGNLVNYSLKHGLSGKEINRNAFRLMPNGSIWIGTDKGLSVYNPNYDFTADIIPRIRITHLLAPGEQWLNPMQELSLPFEDRTIEFFFQPISFYLASEMEFRYKLEGLEDQWVFTDDYWDDNVRYTNLPPGQYTFMVQARYADGEWSETARSAPITILPPFYLTWWFILLAITGISGLGYLMNTVVNHLKNERTLKRTIEEKKAELQNSERRFRAIWEANYTGMALIDLKGSILMANPSLCRLLNVKPEDVLGTPLLYLLPHSVFRKKNLQKIYEEKKAHQSSLSIKLNHKTHHLLVTISLIEELDSDEPLLIIGCKDDTEQKVAEAKNIRLNEELVQQNLALLKKEDELANYNHELLQQREELEQALRIVEEKNYQLDQFVYKTSHDLRAPIASALGLVNIIRMEKDYSNLPTYIQLIDNSLKKQDSFIKAMLNFSRSTRSGNNAEQVDFVGLIHQCLQELKFLPGSSEVQIEVQVVPENYFFYSDRMKIEIILSNMISNSIKYRDVNKSSYLQIFISVNETAAEIILKDNGIGIDRKYTPKIFDMFYRATELSDGSGLGLYIVKQTIDKLHGSIFVESEKGKGSTFKIHIPNQVFPNKQEEIFPEPEDLADLAKEV